MRLVYFTHSLVSCWNHGNAHFLRGLLRELVLRGHDVRVFEPQNAWSLENLLTEEQGPRALDEVRAIYPSPVSMTYAGPHPDLDLALDGADLVIVHEWSAPELVKAVGEKRRSSGFRLLFHDTHHRASTAPEEMGRYELKNYDGVLAFGEVIRQLYLARGWTSAAWTLHEAADPRLFHPHLATPASRDLVWVGNWGDEERTEELHTFLLGPVKRLGLSARVHGVRYPESGKIALKEAGIEFAGWLPNHRVPAAFAQAQMTVHVPRRPYARALPGIPTIRVFEALACGVPLVSAPWDDAEGLFTPGRDYLVARTGEEMKEHLAALKNDPELRASLARHGRETLLSRHTCSHRVDELLGICRELSIDTRVANTEQERVYA